MPPHSPAPSLVVGLTGRMRSGKDTLSAELVAEYKRRYPGVPARAFAFADPLRAALLRLDPLVPATTGPALPLSGLIQRYGWEHVKSTAHAPEVRRLLQNFGQGIREMAPDFWADALAVEVTEWLQIGPCLAVVRDIRYPNEVRALRRLAVGALVIRSVRTDRPVDAADGHESESHADTMAVDLEIRASTVEERLAAVPGVLDRAAKR